MKGSQRKSHITVSPRVLARLRDRPKTLHPHNYTAFGHQTWQDVNLSWWAPTLKVTWPFDRVILRDYVTEEKHYISNTTEPMATKLGRMVICHMTLWSLGRAISRDKLKRISATGFILRPPDLAGWKLNLYRLLPQSHMTLWSRGLARPRDKLKPLYLQYHSVPMATKLGIMLTYVEQLSHINLLDAVVRWSCKITWQTKTTISPHYSPYGHQTWQGGDFPWGAPII